MVDGGTKRWMHKKRQLLSDVEEWLSSWVTKRTSIQLTQALTEHGCFYAYLYRMKRAVSGHWLYCCHPIVNTEHTVFHYLH